MRLPSHLRFDHIAGRRVHLGICGSVAAFKALDVLRALLTLEVRVGATLTASGAEFVTPLSLRALGADPVHEKMYPVRTPEGVYNHLEPAQEGDVFAVIPLTAAMLAKLAYGMADDLLSCQALAMRGPLVVAPAMNQRMWEAPAVQENWKILQRRGVVCITPDDGLMACGEEGNGRLAPVDMLVAELVKALSPKDLAGNKVLISLGPTREYFDPARFWSNPSTGAMGACLAMAAWLRGAHVHVVQGPLGNGAWWFPPDVQVHDVTSAEEMAAACLDVWPDMDLGVMTAAVADYKPTPHADGATKFKKAECGSLDVCFTCNTDILSEMGARKKHGQRLVGFSAETNDLEANASAKLTRKNCDVIVANRIGVPGSGFASPTNEALGLAADGRKQTYPPLAKASLAWKLWDFILDTTR